MIASVLLSVFLLLNPLFAYGDVISPKKQMDLNISITKISCKEGLIKVFKIHNYGIACIKPSSVERLVASGWAQPVDPKSIPKNIEQVPIGEIKPLSIVRQFEEPKRLDTSPRTIGYNFVFEICAFDKSIRIPQVLVTSDSQSRVVTLASMVPANSCQTNSAQIKASDPNTIKGVVTNKGGISEKISGLEDKINSLRQKIQTEKENLILIENSTSADKETKAISKISSILESRKQLNEAKAEYNTYLFSLLVPISKLSEFRSQIEFEAVDSDGIRFETMGYHKELGSTEKPLKYNVVFKVCSDKHDVRVPQVKVTSDVETITVKLADKIPTKTCQTSIAKIKANDKYKITYELGTSNQVSQNISQIQKEIESQQKSLSDWKTKLSELTRNANKPIDYEEKVTNLTGLISDLREKINANKIQLARYQFQFYQ